MILGASTPIACYLAKFLKSKEGCLLYGLSRNKVESVAYEKIYYTDLLSHSFFSVFGNGDIYREYDVVINCVSVVPQKAIRQDDYWTVNIFNLSQLIERLVAVGCIKRILNLSSVSVYPRGPSILVESEEQLPDSPYGISKYVFEKFLQCLQHRGIELVVSLRLPALLTIDTRNNFISNWMAEVKGEGRKFYYQNPSSQFNNIADARILLAIISLMLEGKFASGVVNLGSRNTVTISQLVRTFCRLADVGFDSFVEVAPTKEAQILDLQRISDCGVKLYTVEETLEWYIQQEFRRRMIF